MRAKWAMMGVVFGIGAGAVVAPGTACAFECGIDGPRVPVDGDVDIPTDALLWSYSSRNARLEGPAGEPVATDDRSVDVLVGIALGVLAPREPLEPNTDYSIVIHDGEEYPIRPVRFRTGAGPTTAAPEPPVFRASEPGTGSREFGLSRWQLVSIPSATPGAPRGSAIPSQRGAGPKRRAELWDATGRAARQQHPRRTAGARPACGGAKPGCAAGCRRCSCPG